MNHQSNYPGSVTVTERRWLILFGTIVMLITTIPYVIGYANQGEDWRFTGFILGVEDGNSYIAKMLIGASGGWLFRTPYTASAQRGVVAFLPYILLGKLAQGPGIHEQLVALYHIFRLGAGLLMIFATYDFIALLCRSIRIRRLGLILATLGGGLGWVLLLFGQTQRNGDLPLEFYSPETFGFLSLFGIPHLALARATFLWAIIGYVRQVLMPGEKWWLPSTTIGVFWLLTYFVQPISAVVLGLLFGLHLLVTGVWQIGRWLTHKGIEWRAWLNLFRVIGVAVLITGPYLVYYAFAYATDPFLKSWSAQNILRSPPPLYYLLAFGLIFPFALYGVYKLVKEMPWAGLFFISWIVAFPVLAYAPITVQRRLPEGIWVALITLGMYAVERWEGDRERYTLLNRVANKQVLLGAWVVLSLPSALFLIIGGILAVITPATPIFRPSDETKAFEQFTQIAQSGDIVLASFDTGNAIPAWAPIRVMIGHGPESIGATQLEPGIMSFFEGENTIENKVKFLKDHRIAFVFWGPEEKEIGAWYPGSLEMLVPRYKDGVYEIFQVEGP